MTSEREIELRAFRLMVDEFYRDAIETFAYFDMVLEHFRGGKDIQDELRKFRSERPSMFTLIYDIFHKETEVEEKIAKIGADKEKVDKLNEFKERYKELADEIYLFVLSEMV